MATNLNVPSLNRGLSLKYLVAEKCKPCEIYRRMYVCREKYFSKFFFQIG